MPSLEQNVKWWGNEQGYSWNRQGDEWSDAWGGVDMQWIGSLLPRIHSYLPAATILEIAPGYGRWTQFLKGLCDRLVAIDLNANCIDYCKKRFESDSNLTYHVNDGRSLNAVADRSVDLLFTFDSLVHAESDVMANYVAQFPMVLSPDGVAFVHHSNYAKCRPTGLIERLATRSERHANRHSRALSVSADSIAEMAEQNGLRCVSQEIVNWGGAVLNDCFSVITPRGSKQDRQPVRLVNRGFMTEADGLKALSKLYGAGATHNSSN
jgi:ubiquinone/menaquinone biosynthesis C-methylase UbiE